MKKLILLIACSGIIMTGSLAAQTVIASGDCGANGDNLTWELTDNGILTISGSGAMADFDFASPWSFYSAYISTLIIGNSVTGIGDWAFGGCHGLTSVTIPNSVTSIGDWAFGECHGLTSIQVDDANSYYSSMDGILYNKVQDTLIFCPQGKTGTVTIPNSVTSIEETAFVSCYRLTSVTIGSLVTSIGNYAFDECSGLSSITCLAAVPPALVGNCFYGVPDNVSVCVPASSVAAYQSSVWGSWFINISGCAPVGISETDGEHTAVAVYPNPVQNTLYIQSSSAIEQLTIYDIGGRMLKQLSNPGHSINVSSLAKGIYPVRIKTEAGEVIRKVIKNY